MSRTRNTTPAHSAHSADPDAYWRDFANVERELRAFIAEQKLPPLMPTLRQLWAAGRSDLVSIIQRKGGRSVVAGRIGLECPPVHKPRGYWRDPANVDRELLAYIAEHGTPGVMPQMRELAEHGRMNLHGAIAAHGGYQAIARRLGLKLVGKHRPDGYWRDFANVERELLAYLHERGETQWMPSVAELLAADRVPLLNGIARHGGLRAVARRLGLTRRSRDGRPRREWSDFAVVARELQAFIAEHGRAGVMPTLIELRSAGQSSLVAALYRHGGPRAVAARLKLKPAKRSRRRKGGSQS
jgi:hypothetical protein